MGMAAWRVHRPNFRWNGVESFRIIYGRGRSSYTTTHPYHNDHTHDHTYSHSDDHFDRHTNCDTDTYADSYTHPHTNSHIYQNPRSISNPHPFTHAHNLAHTLPTPAIVDAHGYQHECTHLHANTL
jgi:hypothetical protein